MFSNGFPKEWSTIRKLIWLHAILGGTPATTLTVTGVSPLSLVNAVAHNIVSLTQTGKCEQASTPTPSSPVDIYCNNGTLMMVDDELPVGYKRVLGFSMNNNSYWEIADFPLYGSDTLRFAFEASDACNVIGAYSGSASGNNYSLYVSTSSNYLRYKSGAYNSAIDFNKRYDVEITPNGSSGMKTDSTWTAQTFTTPTNLCIGTTATSASSAKLKGKLYSNIEVVGRAKFVPCERVSDNALGYYDIIGEAFYEQNASYNGAVSLGYDGSHYTLGVVGTPETLTVSATGQTPQTVSVQNLLAIPNHADTQEIISGEVRRKIGYYVFDGTETFSTSTAYGKSILLQSASVKWGATKDCTPVCSHFQGVAQASSTQPEGTCFFNASGHFYFRVADNDTAAFKTWLADLYAAGTPVILLFARSTETTEQTTAHALHTAQGTNVVTAVTNVDPVTLTVEYKGKTP